MRPAGSYKIGRGARRFHGARNGVPSGVDGALGNALRSERRLQRILESLREQITEAGDDQELRIRRVFQNPREIFRVEIDLPALGYQRTTLLDREALEELLAWDDVRARVSHHV